MRAVVAIGAAVLVAFGLAGASAATGPHAQSAVRLGPNIRESKVAGTQADVGWASRNWSGYVVQHLNSYSGVEGNWTVPTVTSCSDHGRNAACYSAAWAGIDGSDNASLIQTGTEQDYSNRGGATYSAWWTTSSLGYVEQTISFSQPHGHGHHQGGDPCSTDPNQNCGTVAAGDKVTADISIAGGVGTITLKDSNQGWTFTTTAAYSGPADSAEWIMEAPTVGGKIATMPNYEKFPFDPNSVNDGTGPDLQAADGGELIQKGQVESIPSGPDTSADGFNMYYGATAGSAPTNS